MAVSILEEEDLGDEGYERPALRLVPTEEDRPPPPTRPTIPPQPLPKVALDALAATASVLSARLTLVLAVIGAFILAMMVVQNPTVPALVALAIFTSLIGPLCWLAQKRVT